MGRLWNLKIGSQNINKETIASNTQNRGLGLNPKAMSFGFRLNHAEIDKDSPRVTQIAEGVHEVKLSAASGQRNSADDREDNGKQLDLKPATGRISVGKHTLLPLYLMTLCSLGVAGGCFGYAWSTLKN